MRSIPTELKTRIEKAHQTLYENANPHMKIFVYNSRWNELFTVYTIHNKADIDRIDVTAKRETAEAEPNKLYAIYIEDGVSYVISKDLPYDETVPWDAEFTAGSASDIAIEFNGYWERDQVSKRFNFVADEYPWVFKQNSGSLTAQYWDGTSLELATGVGRICTIRGWLPAQADHTSDQGLIVAYLKSGVAYYRNYCLQSDGTTYLWETEQEITQLPSGLTDIALFRTNDFRIGVLGRDASDNAHMTVTTRNWAGMSLYPEVPTIEVQLGLTYTPIEYIDTYSPTEVPTIETILEGLEYCHISIPIPALVEVRRISETESEIEINLPPINVAGSESGWTMTETVSGNPLTISSMTSAGNIITINHNSVDSSLDIDLAYDETLGRLRLYGSDTCRRLLNSFTALLEGEPPVGYTPDEVPTIEVQLGVEYIEMERLYGHSPEEVPTIEVEIGLTLTDLNGDPV